jgi:hypothetical protein
MRWTNLLIAMVIASAVGVYGYVKIASLSPDRAHASEKGVSARNHQLDEMMDEIDKQ